MEDKFIIGDLTFTFVPVEVLIMAFVAFTLDVEMHDFGLAFVFFSPLTLFYRIFYHPSLSITLNLVFKYVP